MKDKYNKYKLIYKNYIIFIKCGSFYVTLNDDSIVLNNIFHFKISELKENIKCGFPLESLNKVINTLDDLKINYILLDNGIIDKKKYTTNNYLKYIDKTKYILLKRIDNINNILKLNIDNSNINNILGEIEGCLCKISY